MNFKVLSKGYVYKLRHWVKVKNLATICSNKGNCSERLKASGPSFEETAGVVLKINSACPNR